MTRCKPGRTYRVREESRPLATSGPTLDSGVFPFRTAQSGELVLQNVDVFGRGCCGAASGRGASGGVGTKPYRTASRGPPNDGGEPHNFCRRSVMGKVSGFGRSGPQPKLGAPQANCPGQSHGICATLSTLPSGSLNHATRAPACTPATSGPLGEVQMASSSWPFIQG